MLHAVTYLYATNQRISKYLNKRTVVHLAKMGTFSPTTYKYQRFPVFPDCILWTNSTEIFTTTSSHRTRRCLTALVVAILVSFLCQRCDFHLSLVHVVSRLARPFDSSCAFPRVCPLSRDQTVMIVDDSRWEFATKRYQTLIDYHQLSSTIITVWSRL